MSPNGPCLFPLLESRELGLGRGVWNGSGEVERVKVWLFDVWCCVPHKLYLCMYLWLVIWFLFPYDLFSAIMTSKFHPLFWTAPLPWPFFYPKALMGNQPGCLNLLSDIHLKNVHTASRALKNAQNGKGKTRTRSRRVESWGHEQENQSLLYGKEVGQAERWRSDSLVRASSLRCRFHTASRPMVRHGKPKILLHCKVGVGVDIIVSVMQEMEKKGLTGWGFPSFTPIPASNRLAVMASGEVKEGLGRNRCSKMAMMRNRETRMAVATKPKDIASTDAPKPFQGAWASLSTAAWDGLGSKLV